MNGYTKLFGSIVASTIWREAKETKIVWITMLAMANKDGVVEASIPGLADLSRVSVEEAQDAITTLMSPDPYSRTKDFEGRRIDEIDGGWRILNHAKYRAKMNADERREYFRIKKQESRSKAVNKSQRKSKTVQERPNSSTPSTQSEAEAEAERTSQGSSKEDARWSELLKTYREAGVDVVKEERDARAWVIAHPGRKFTLDFFRNWLKRTAEKLPPRKPKEELIVTEYQGPTAETFLRK